VGREKGHNLTKARQLKVSDAKHPRGGELEHTKQKNHPGKDANKSIGVLSEEKTQSKMGGKHPADSNRE